MKKQTLFILVFLIAGFCSRAQQSFLKTFSGSTDIVANNVIVTSDGGYALAGTVNPGSFGSNDAWLIKTNSSGDTLWTRRYGRQYGETIYALCQTQDGGFALFGSSDSYAPGVNGLFLMKTDAAGNFLWSKVYGGLNASYLDEGICFTETSDGGFVLAGNTQTYSAGSSDIYLVKTDAAGNLIWTKSYGGTGAENTRAIKQTNDGGYIVTGFYTNFTANNTWDAFLLKTNATGNMSWYKTYGGTGNEFAYDVK